MIIRNRHGESGKKDTKRGVKTKLSEKIKFKMEDKNPVLRNYTSVYKNHKKFPSIIHVTVGINPHNFVTLTLFLKLSQISSISNNNNIKKT